MCLHTVDKETKQVSEGWKIFDTYNNKLSGMVWNFDFKTNEWIKDSKHYTLPELYKEGKYQTGFHFYLNKEDAEKWSKAYMYNYKIMHIKVRNVVATGFQDGYRIGVAREIFIEEDK